MFNKTMFSAFALTACLLVVGCSGGQTASLSDEATGVTGGETSAPERSADVGSSPAGSGSASSDSPATDTAPPTSSESTSQPATQADPIQMQLGPPSSSVTSGSATGLGALLDGYEGLTIGAKAPALDVDHWISNGSGKYPEVTEFEPGKVYVVEFWATWCIPCIRAMPHIIGLQEEYADQGVQFISISREKLETVSGFLQQEYGGPGNARTFGELTSRYSLTVDPDQSAYKSYMGASGQISIPNCFVVGKTGQLEWVGNPVLVEGPLKEVIAGTWDREAFAETFSKEQEFGLVLNRIIEIGEGGDIDGAFALAAKAKPLVGGRDLQMIEEAEAQPLLQKVVDLAQAGNLDESLALIAANKSKLSGRGLELVSEIEGQVMMLPVSQKIEAGDFAGGIEELEKLIAKSDGDKILQLRYNRVGLLIQSKIDDAKAATGVLELLEDLPPNALHNLASTIFNRADSGEVSPELLDAGIATAEKTVEMAPEQGVPLDTLARLLFKKGDLDRALKVQTEAARFPGQAAVEINQFLEELKAAKAGE